MNPKQFFQLLGEDGMKDIQHRKVYTQPTEDVELDEILIKDIEPSQKELEYLISWGEVARALEYARTHNLRAKPLKFLISRVVRYCCDTGEDLVNVIQTLFWKEA